MASLGFLGLGPTPPTPEWCLLLAEGMPYVERAPWAVLAPTVALVNAAVLAVSLSGLSRRPVRPAATAPPPAPAGEVLPAPPVPAVPVAPVAVAHAPDR